MNNYNKSRVSRLWADIAKNKDNLDVKNGQEYRELKAFVSNMSNSLILDFRSTSLSIEEAMKLIKEKFNKANKVNITSKQRIIELGFPSKEDRDEALKEEFIVNNQVIKLISLTHITEQDHKIYIDNLDALKSKEETENALKTLFSAYGTVTGVNII